ncbi:beta-1,4 mannanase [Photobacterium sanctipauli]|uniref:mannan endo-1,4-beta-mannosidase n=1 Tax=Photobacterium sanctipauli TaxID=1342794 RepID=A0A2T3P121_9GAMM|nr:CBM35 domain-containing protein [Photobacterium sanctipauli]PSW22200.1 beta-1,4 mannanase [Photobacterium sanctipauli]
MKTNLSKAATLMALALGTSMVSAASPSGFEHFITRDGHQLLDGSQPFRFAGIHAPELHRIEDDAKGICQEDPRGWGQYFKWPTHEEQENWIKAMVRTGHKAQRVYVLSIEQEHDKVCDRETHILAPETKGEMPRLNEEAMRVYDNMIALADKHGLRLILPFIDHWWWWGGREQLAAFYDEAADDFYDVNSKTYAAYKDIIRQVITRTNTVTGRPYFEEKAIMAWETGNELEYTNAPFLKETAALIKQLAPHQLVMDGTYKAVNEFALDDPNIDIISNHYYTNAGNNHPDQVRKDLAAIQGKKVYYVGEFGLRDHTELNDIMQAIVHTEVDGAQAAGGFVWGFRGHRHDGGFYWHKEYTGHYSYHLPGFPVEGEANQEIEVVDLVRLAAAQMDGQETVPALPVPESPVLRETSSPFAINWMGAPVGRYYDVERATNISGPWQTVGENISDGINEWDPATMDLFSDDYHSLQLGETYFYRVIAKNESGESSPSNVITVKHSQANQAPAITMDKQLSTTLEAGVLLEVTVKDDGLPTSEVTTQWQSSGESGARFCQPNSVTTRAYFAEPGQYQLTLTADDGLLKSSKTVTVDVDEAQGAVPDDYCHYQSETHGLDRGAITRIDAEQEQLSIDEDGFLGPFAQEGDSVAWTIEAPWQGDFTLNLHYSGKWGNKMNSIQINDGHPQQFEFIATDDKGGVLSVPVRLAKGDNQLIFGKFPGDWGYMFVKEISISTL